MASIFNKKFWINEWIKDQDSDTFQVHKGYSSADYWDKAALSYDQDEDERKSRKQDKVLAMFQRNKLLKKNIKVLDIGCGTGMLSVGLAKKGAKITAVDFSNGMLDQFRKRLTEKENQDIQNRIEIIEADWHTLDIKAYGWEKAFDLVIAFMSPGVATPQAFGKMMACSKKGCAIRGWAAKQNHPILAHLWQKIMGTELEDKPQSILYKINLLFSLGLFPEICFDVVEWFQDTTVEEELDRQMAFFSKVARLGKKELEAVIREYLESILENGRIVRKHKGLTATAVWQIKPLLAD